VSIRERVLKKIAAVSCDHAWGVVAVFILVTAFAVTVIAFRGRVSTDLTDVLPKNSKEAELYVEAAEHFAADMLIIAFESDDPARIDEAKPYVEALAGRLPLLTRKLSDGKTEDLVKSVDYKVGEKARKFAREIAVERGYLFLDSEDRAAFTEKLASATIEKQMVANRRKYDAMGIDYFERAIIPDPLNLREILARHKGNAGGQFVPKEGESYLVSPDGAMLIMLARATRPMKDMTFDRDLMVAVREAEAGLWDEFTSADPAVRAKLKEELASRGIDLPGDAAAWTALRGAVKVTHTGGYAIAESENRLLKHDLLWCFATSLVFVLAIFALGFRRLGALFYIGLPLVASVTWTLAAAFLAFGHISMMSGGFAAILVGLSVDFAIHIYNSYVSERARGVDVRAAIEGAITGSGSGIFFGALTSSVAFFGVMLTRFVGLKEFGFLAGIGVLLGMTAMFFVLPALLFLRSRVAEESKMATEIYGFHLEIVARMVDRRPGLVFGVGAALALAAGVFVYTTMTVYFFDSDLKNLRSESEIFDLAERIQRKFGTNLAPLVTLSRGATPDEALTKAATLLGSVRELKRGVSIERTSWPANAAAVGQPFIRVDGCHARVRRVEIVLPRDAALPENLASTTVVLTRPDGSRLIVYKFATDADMADWEFEGARLFYPGSVELGCEAGRGSVMRWRHELAGSAEVTYSVRYLGDVSAIAMGLGPRVAVRAQAGGAPALKGAPWPPVERDQVRLTLVVSAEAANGEWSLEFVAGRGTIQSVDSVARLVPPRAQQVASASFVAAIDVDRIADDIDEYARAARLRPIAFEDFVDKLRSMVERAGEEKYLTLDEIASSEFSAILSKYYAKIPGKADGRVHTVATYLYPEQGEMPREWYGRVAGALGGMGEVTASRLVSLAVRDVVHDDFSWLTKLVFAGVLMSLLWSFRSLRWSVVALLPVFASFALMLATLLIIGHRLNFMNVLVFPILVGIGIDYGIHVVHRFRAGASVHAIITETGRAFVLTTLTTMAGFGSLVISRYKGLSSFGFVTIMGMLFVLLTSLVVLPAMLALVERRRKATTAFNRDGQDG
jgi:predicted RND superfamily exporter protein